MSNFRTREAVFTRFYQEDKMYEKHLDRLK